MPTAIVAAMQLLRKVSMCNAWPRSRLSASGNRFTASSCSTTKFQALTPGRLAPSTATPAHPVMDSATYLQVSEIDGPASVPKTTAAHHAAQAAMAQDVAWTKLVG